VEGVFPLFPTMLFLLGGCQLHQPSEASLPNDPLLPPDLSGWGSQDVAIAAFLMLLWRDMYAARVDGERDWDERQMWDKWGRPPRGFVDLGCVSGL